MAAPADDSHDGSDDKFSFCIDRGGTFTDVFALVPVCGADCSQSHAHVTRSSRARVLKLLSEDPASYRDAPTEGIRRVLEAATGEPHPRGAPIPTRRIASIRMATTVATNALLTRSGARTACVVTAGFKHLLAIGNQSRPAIFDLRMRAREHVYERVVEVQERLVLVQEGDVPGPEDVIITASTGERVRVEQAPDVARVRADLQAVYDDGIRSIAIVFMHAYAVPAHELLVAQLARSMGFTHVSMSSEVMPMVKIVPRGYTACADAYLTPHIVTYVNGFKAGFDAGLDTSVRLSFMQSDGGLTPVQFFSGHKAVLSGPAGGVVGYALTTWDPVARTPIVAFDMGGTSTDVSRFDGRFEHVYETSIAGITMQAPQLDISTVAAGGGSRLFFRSGLFVVGPDSVGAHPGPVCYRKNGFLAVTDANLMLGRIVVESFPSIFGPHENEPLDADATRGAFQTLATDINAHNAAHGGAAMSLDEIAYGFIRVANEAMCRPIRALTQMKGYDITTHTLACFGGAGPQHACAIARALGMRRIFISRYSGILSAYGLSLADMCAEAQAPTADVLIPAPSDAAGWTAHAAARADRVPAVVASSLTSKLQALTATVVERLAAQGCAPADMFMEMYVNLRYAGTDTHIMTPVYDSSSARSVSEAHSASGTPAQTHVHSILTRTMALPSLDASQTKFVTACVSSAAAHFVASYEREYGFTLCARDILCDDVRVRGIARAAAPARALIRVDSGVPAHAFTKQVYFEGGRVDTPVFQMRDLACGHRVCGPALIIDDTATIVVEPSYVAALTRYGDVEITRDDDAARADDASRMREAAVHADPIQLSIFSHRFMGIAEQMGRVLQRTSISVNMRERLDYSCALFSPDGGLVANAPHIPVHLGAMQDAVRYQCAHWGENIHEGDVFVSNHPQLAGGSHLPDITVITPVFSNGRIVFFVASRGHHADIGGIAPGSMPPNSKLLTEEGAAIIAHKIVQAGVFDEAGMTDILTAPGRSGIPGVSGSRNLKDCISDLRAQVAANNTGIHLVRSLIEEYSLPHVHSYMRHIQTAAEMCVRDMLVAFSLSRGLAEVDTLTAVDYMDDGTPIALAVTIDRIARTATFDFTGTGPEVWANTNAPRAVTYSAIIYSLRCLVGRDVPLNQGCLTPVTINIPSGTLLHPSATAGVVGGNVLTSQRVVDVVLRAFGACAASQGCMNNLTLGDDSFGYYETIAGGAGAGPEWPGRSGVHTHMTNTRITDPEILERRYPVILRSFTLRGDSGGRGAFAGGDGCIREMQFRRPLIVSILSERRSRAPYGLLGGGSGARGINTLVRIDGRRVNLGAKSTVAVQAGERLCIETPGGGGFGLPPHADAAAHAAVPYAEQLQREEYGAAVAAAVAMGAPLSEHVRRVLQRVEQPMVAAPAPQGASTAAADVDPPLIFSGSVGKYKETQESV